MNNIKKLLSFDKNCLLCKYKYDNDACSNAIFKHNYKCPTISNIWHGKLSKLFPFCIIDKIIDKKQELDAEKLYDDYNEDGTENSTMKLIWGLKSYDDLSGQKCSLLTMNDIEVIYLKDKNKYIVSIETIYLFDNKQAEYNYLKDLLDKFTEFMEQNNYDTTKDLGLYEAFTIGINTNFDSLEDCYAAFKMNVNGYCSLGEKYGM